MKTTLLALGFIVMAGQAEAQGCPQDGSGAPLALHKAWIPGGWERREDDPKSFVIGKMDESYDLKAPHGTFSDDLAPGKTQLFDDAAVCGANREDLRNAARTVRHVLTDGDDQLVGDRVASTTIGFAGRIDRLDGKAIAFEGRSQLGWACADGAWKIHQEMAYAWMVKPEAIARYDRKDATK